MSHVRQTPGLVRPLPLPTTPTSTGSASRPSAGSTSCGRRTRTRNWPTRSSTSRRQYGFSSWRALKAHVDSLTSTASCSTRRGTATSSRLRGAARRASGQAARARRSRTSGRCCTSRRTTGHLAAVDLLLKRGLDVNTREKGDNTYAMHWAAAAGSPRRRAPARRRGRRRRRTRRRPRAGGHRLGDVLGRMRRRRASRGRGFSRQPRRAAPHLLRDRDEPRGRSPPHRRGRSVSAQPADEPQREPPAAAALRRADESPRDGGAAAGARRRSAGVRWLRLSRRDVRLVPGHRSAA